jgi:CspA family cold shock protein
MRCRVATGKVVRFDQTRGYGFLAPAGGGEDVFLHVNDLLVEKSAVLPGTIMEFDIEEGDRGPKASAVRIVSSVQARSGSTPVAGLTEVRNTDGLCDVLATGEYLQEVTELLLRSEPTLTGGQITNIRRQLVLVAEKYGWVES